MRPNLNRPSENGADRRAPASSPVSPVRGEPLVLNPDRFFDPDPSIRRVARSLFEETSTLPLICPHGHVDPRLLAEDTPFPEPASLLIVPDHYIFRLLYARGIPLELMGVPRADGQPTETDPRAIWQRFASHYDRFGVRVKLNADTALAIYDQIAERLASSEFRPRALFRRFNIEVLATTDKATDTLEHHRCIHESGWGGRVIPTFRPDALFRVAAPGWRDELRALSSAVDRPIHTLAEFERALAERRAYFIGLGATATDHAVLEPLAQELPAREADALFGRALGGKATAEDQRLFEAHMLMVMAGMSSDDGLVMQLHAGAFRDHNPGLAAEFGPDKGADIPVATEFTRNLRPLLDRYGSDRRFTLVLFTLDESTYSRELAPLAGHYPAVRLGPPWWFHDSIEGMTRYRQHTTETASIYKTAGFNDDTRAFCSIPARHDLNRRVDANYLAGLVSRHVIDVGDARVMAHALAYELARETYKLDRHAAKGAAAVASEAVR